MKSLKFLFAFTYFFIASAAFSQWQDTVTLPFGQYKLTAIYDTTNFCSDLIVTKDSKVIFKEDCVEGRITSLEAQDLEGKGKKIILVETFSGGAHCCTNLMAANIVNDKYAYTDTILWGNSGYEISDLNNDGIKEIVGYNDMFAYAFTNFAQSRFPIAIYNFKNGKFSLVNDKFEDKVMQSIKELKDELKDYIKQGFDCPRSENDDTFNTDAGAVKALLAPIVADYFSIGMVDEGYDYVKKIYKCPDRNKFINILKKDYKLK